MNSNSKRKTILMAASIIVKNNGVEKLTLEAVAKEAGVSKGGLLHHFPNKEALIKGMVEELTNDFFINVQDRAMSATVETGKWIRAFTEVVSEDIKEGREISTALTAALFTNPDILSKFQNQYAMWQKNIENDGIDPVLSTIVRLAADGLWYSEMFGLGVLDDELRTKVIQELINMTK
ncbi:TetR/AcrR family transcriptional regulator [Paenibacillus sp. FSL K6-0276]|uniref:TetR/AcrR family transcriptional regulator n=1 Tax=unclassified Paenibacillus TaxID=185978 RepID=UPI0028AFE78F|nr:TetR/AcrR family transcriptional regulator [Paenibacillus sp.]